MYFLSWNVRGLGSPHKRACIKNYLHLFHLDLLLIQESKLCRPTRAILKSFSGTSFNTWSILDSIDSSGGIIIGWLDSKFCLQDEKKGTFTLSVKLQDLSSNRIFTITSVYGPCGNVDRSTLWQELRDIATWATSDWLLGGDFNITRVHGERRGTDIYIDDMLLFNTLIREL